MAMEGAGPSSLGVGGALAGPSGVHLARPTNLHPLGVCPSGRRE